MSDCSEILYEEAKRHVDEGYMTKTAKFLTSNMADGRHFENRKSPYLSEKSSDFDESWYTTSDIEPDDSRLTKD